MHRTIPKVQGTRLYQSQTGADPIVVGTWAWYDWLEHHNSFVFVDGHGTFTASKSATTPSELDWEACRMSTDKRLRLWLGASGTLSLERLRAAAQALAEAQAPTEPPDALHMVATASRLPTPTTSAHLGPLMRTKLCRPRTSSDVIPRARLIERLNAGLSSNLTLLSAPAGFGKTTLLVALLETIDRHTAWLTLLTELISRC